MFRSTKEAKSLIKINNNSLNSELKIPSFPGLHNRKKSKSYIQSNGI